MKKLFKTQGILSLLLMFFCCYSLSIDAEIPGKKKKKENVAQQQPVVIEDYGKTVTLVTSGTGKTEDEATKIAIRNALEQAYGTFVSSNTTVVNDELVTDAITTVSSGNVMGYDLISRIDMPSGECQVSVRSVVSIGDLVTFATSRGMTAELAGNTFLMNRNLARLNKENECVALNNLVKQLSMIVNKGMYDYTVDVAQPRKAISRDAAYAIDVKVNVSPNANYELFWETIDRTLSSLSMSPTESANYKSLEMNTYLYSYAPSWDGFKIDTKPDLVGRKSNYILRNNIGRVVYGRVLSDKKTEVFLLDMIQALEKMGKYCYELYDNLGNTVTPTVYAKDKISTDHEIKYGIDGFRIHDDRFSIVLIESSKFQYRISRAAEAHEKGMVHRSFVMQYNESELSKLRNISIRPHQLNFDLSLAMQDPEEYENALIQKLDIMEKGLKTKEDSLKYANNLKAIYTEHKSNSVMERLCKTLFGLGQTAEANKILDDALASDPNNFVALVDKGVTLFKTNKAEEAVKYFKKALEVKPDNATIATYAGLAYGVQAQKVEDPAQKKKLYKQAIGLFDRAKELDPDMLQVKWGYNRYNAYYHYYGADAPETKKAEQESR